MRRLLIGCTLFLFGHGCVLQWAEPPKPTWDQQVGAILDNVFGHLDNLRD